MKQILLTGGTGFIGSHMAYKLLENGYNIIFLAREKRGESAYSRVKNALSFVGPCSKFLSQFQVIDGDITEPISDFTECKDVEEVWHLAASISFKQEHAERTYNANVVGTKNVIDFSRKARAILHYFSTAYVCGSYKGRFFEEDLDCGQRLRNPYEETKFEAEKLVRGSKLDSNIYRLGIVVGNSKTGRTPVFTGYYTFARMLCYIRDSILDAISKNGISYFNNGFFTNGDGFLKFPVKIPCHPESTVNLIPIDFLVNGIYAIASNLKSLGKTFHIVNPRPPTVRWIFDTSLEIMKMRGFQLVDLNNPSAVSESIEEAGSKQILYKIEMSIRDLCGAYLPYITSEPVFDDFNTRSFGVLIPPLRKELIKKLLEYAIKRNFGRHPERVISVPTHSIAPSK